jgi:hypothetical protein
MHLRIDDLSSVGLGGGLVRALRRQQRAGAGRKRTGDKVASSRHGSSSLKLTATAFIHRRRLQPDCATFRPGATTALNASTASKPTWELDAARTRRRNINYLMTTVLTT